MFSYDGRLQFGFNADWDLVPDLHDLVLDVERALDELRQAAVADGGVRSAPEPPASAVSA